jgi:hypothetical protein
MLEKCSPQIDKICIYIFLLQLAMDKHHLVCGNDDKKWEQRQGKARSARLFKRLKPYLTLALHLKACVGCKHLSKVQ